jgi:hypothetical protein
VLEGYTKANHLDVDLSRRLDRHIFDILPSEQPSA